MIDDPLSPTASNDALSAQAARDLAARRLAGNVKARPREIPFPYRNWGEYLTDALRPDRVEQMFMGLGTDAGAGGIKAFHGSPHDFARFDMSKVGTGEGAQAYGHGLYFAEHEPTAESYRRSTSDLRDWNVGDTRIPSWLGKKASASPHGLDESIADFTQRAEQMRQEGHWNAQGIQDIADALREVKAGKAQLRKPGHMYEVSINADPEHFLDWDKPLSEQAIEEAVPHKTIVPQHFCRRSL